MSAIIEDQIAHQKDSAEIPSRSNFLKGAMIGGMAGIGAALLYQAVEKILRQPRLVSQTIFSEIKDFDNRVTRMVFIAAEGLRFGIKTRRLEGLGEKQILHAGYRNFRESWARDFGFAALGLLALEEHTAVRETLEAFFSFQTPQGQLPVKLRSLSVVNRFLHSLLGREQPLQAELKPKFQTGHRTASLDGQALLVNAACAYLESSGDRTFISEQWDTLVRSISWLTNHSESGSELLSQEPYADWADSVARKGVVLYTNVVYWRALCAMARAAATLNKKTQAEVYQRRADNIASDIQSTFWRRELGYYQTSREMPNLSSAGNLLAIVWGLADQHQSQSILYAIHTAGMTYPVPTQAAYPPYNPADIALENRLGNLSNYHTSAAWLWVGAWHALALQHAGRTDQAVDILERIAAVVVREGQVYEVYGLDGRPLSTYAYTAEAPLTWNAGMLIFAVKNIENQLQ